MFLRSSVLLLSTVIVQGQRLTPSWNGLWKEDAAKSSIFVPGTLSIQAAPGRGYFLVGRKGQRSRLQCVSGSQADGSCLSLSASRWIDEHGLSSGTEYRLNDRATELEVDNWRIVPDRSRLVDTDFYARSNTGTGFAGRWHKTRSTESPTVYRVSMDGDRMFLAVPNGEINVSFSLQEARTAKGSYYAFSPARGNIYKVLGPSKILEQSLLRGKLIGKSVMTLSPDGQTMTEDHTIPNHPLSAVHVVYDRDDHQDR